jgi:hypothetical protein
VNADLSSRTTTTASPLVTAGGELLHSTRQKQHLIAPSISLAITSTIDITINLIDPILTPGIGASILDSHA